MRKLNMGEWIGIVVTIAVVGSVFWKGWFESSGISKLAPWGTNTAEDKGVEATTTTNATVESTNTNTKMKNISTTAGLEIYDKVIGTGAEAVSGKKITVHYVGTLASDGSKFDSSVDRGQPFEFNLGAGQVIKGWELGFAGMKIGGTRQLVISPELGYGNNQAGPIPPGSTLIFEVQLLKVQ